MAQDRSSGRQAALARAMDYPYAAHPGPYLFRGGKAEPLPADLDIARLTPVIAVGSNRAPVQLARKFERMETAIPVTRLVARHLDVVHAAHMAGYGAVPATLAPSPGTEVELWITWLDAPTMHRMDATEAVGVNYAREEQVLEIVAADGPAPERALVYNALRGCLSFDGAMVPLAAVPASRRRSPAMTQRAVLERLHREAGSPSDFERWLHGHIGPTGLLRRTRLTERLAAGAIRPRG
ncbi:hypothetical protein T8K17_05900 [Thalassobaculum sp. OXR-137]|uniref:hypothetical protein n=1 Tax=Thalassobaculum sp. OXR-137 TaxID=3100173 RepID=UPI002AC8A07B|nr:hypothetical protein [Thalassobaculum sp. OXR-137]WPZ35674.1 hypothetical protein T8K17_05900 [Thalassobaculum sp. OXR-137]